MKRMTPVRLTKRDLREWNETGAIKATPPTEKDCYLVLRKIGLDGMAARDRGVAKVSRRA